MGAWRRGTEHYEVRTIPRIRSQPLPLPSGPSSSPILFSRGEDPSVRALHCRQRTGAGRHAAHAGCARRLGAPGLRPLLLQVEGASHRPSLCLEWGVSAVFLHFLGLRRETLRTPGGPRRRWPRCRQASAQPPVKAWLPRAGTTARGLCSSGPGQPPARGLLATSFGLEMCSTFRVDNRWQQTEQEKAFVTLQPAVKTVCVDGCNQPMASVPSGSSPGCWRTAVALEDRGHRDSAPSSHTAWQRQSTTLKRLKRQVIREGALLRWTDKT